MSASPEPDFIHTAPWHMQAALRTERALTQWISRENFVRDRIAYRVIDVGIGRAKGCLRDLGLFSRQRNDDSDPWKRHLVVHHLTDGKGTSKISDHHAHKSIYMSILTSPDKVRTFVQRRETEKEIVIIDMDMADIVGVKYRSTLDLRSEYQLQDEADGITFTSPSHYLVYQHIPQCCILGFMPARTFLSIWDRKKQELPEGQARQLDWDIDLKDNVDMRATSIFVEDPPPTLMVGDTLARPRTPPPPSSSSRAFRRTTDLTQADSDLPPPRSPTSTPFRRTVNSSRAGIALQQPRTPVSDRLRRSTNILRGTTLGDGSPSAKRTRTMANYEDDSQELHESHRRNLFKATGDL